MASTVRVARPPHDVVTTCRPGPASSGTGKVAGPNSPVASRGAVTRVRSPSSTAGGRERRGQVPVATTSAPVAARSGSSSRVGAASTVNEASPPHSVASGTSPASAAPGMSTSNPANLPCSSRATVNVSKPPTVRTVSVGKNRPSGSSTAGQLPLTATVAGATPRDGETARSAVGAGAAAAAGTAERTAISTAATAVPRCRMCASPPRPVSEPSTGLEGHSGPGPSCSSALPGVADVVAVVDAPPVRRVLVTVLLGGLLLAAGVLVAAPASACSCAAGTTADYFERADAVFTASLFSRDVDHPNWPVASGDDPALYVFTTHVVFKGEVGEAQGVVSADSGASCGLELSGKGPFVVFANRDPELPEGRYRAGLCDGSAVLDPAVVAELAELTTLTTSTGAPGALPAQGAAGVDSSGPGPVPALLIGAGVLGALVAGWVVLRRQRVSR